MNTLNKLVNEFKNLLWGTGYFAPQISILYALFVAFKFSYLYVLEFIIFILLSTWFNLFVLKRYFYSPRPRESIPFLASESFNKTSNGMPSGHAQTTTFALTFAYLVSGTYFYESIALALITTAQRYVFYNHTALQLFVGNVLGFVLAFILVYLANRVNREGATNEFDTYLDANNNAESKSIKSNKSKTKSE
jgi:membrane-associated phospholipid phosphatase